MFKIKILKNIAPKILLFLMLFTVLACTTQRKKGETGKIGKMYHNTTAKYNGYFNANELVDESIITLKDQYETNYSMILPVYDYVAVDNISSVSENLDIAIEKVITVTALHEPSHWVDDCYVLMGKAQYLKQDYQSAQETLEYFEEQFDPKNPYGRNYVKAKNTSRTKKDRKRIQKEREKERKESDKIKAQEKKDREKAREEEKKARDKARKEAIKNRKKGIRTPKSSTENKTKTTEKTATSSSRSKNDKEDEYVPSKKKEEKKDDSYDGGAFKHRPAYYEGMLWLSRVYIERERYQSAERLLKEIEEAPSLSREVKRELPVAKAHLSISQEEYGQAIDPMILAIDRSNDRQTKARYNFIAAQLYERVGDISKANEAYDQSMKLSQIYELAFNAQINKIKAAHAKGGSSSEASLNKFARMLRDEKNIGYEGQIYYSRAEIFIEDGDIKSAQEELKYALASGGNTSAIMVEAYYKLAGIYFDQEKYVEAKNYYDSTLVVMDKEDFRIREVTNYATILDDIVANIDIIERQDSLLRLSLLSKDEIREKAEEILKNSALATEQSRSSGKIINGVKGNSRVLAGGRSTFFAYNPLSKSKGISDFKIIWGQRALEDNWRRSQRGSANTVDVEFGEDGDKEEEVVISEADIARIMKDIPYSPEAKTIANERIMNAMMELGVLYRDRLQNYKKSADILEKLTDRYPNFELTDQALYYLYLSYNDLGKSQKASAVLARMKREFPDSQFTKLAINPTYATEIIKDQNKLQYYYDETYVLFTQHKHKKVISRINEAATIFGQDNELAAKFDLLKAMSIGHNKGEKAYIQQLEILIKKYPNTEEEVRANEILRFLKGDADAFDDALYSEAAQLFEKEPDQLHYALLVVYELPRKTLDKVKIGVSDFNKKYHRLNKDLKISNITLSRENKAQIVMVRGFESEEKAMIYYESFMDNKNEVIDPKLGHDFFVSTQKNFREMIKQRTTSNYRVFFEANYLQDNK